MYELKNWNEVAKGIYRYVIGANVAYEICILYWDHATDILSANCNLFLVGDWRTKDHKNITERELLLGSASLAACLEKAIEDNDENNNIPG